MNSKRTSISLPIELWNEVQEQKKISNFNLSKEAAVGVRNALHRVRVANDYNDIDFHQEMDKKYKAYLKVLDESEIKKVLVGFFQDTPFDQLVLIFETADGVATPHNVPDDYIRSIVLKHGRAMWESMKEKMGWRLKGGHDG